MNNPKLARIWRQDKVPVLFDQGGPRGLLVKLPYATENRVWLRDERRAIPEFNKTYKAWKIPKAWFDDIVERTLSRFGQVYVIQAHREQQKCAPACWNATGYHCECSCMGANHGNGYPGGAWREVSDTFALSYGPRKYACRLMKVK